MRSKSRFTTLVLLETRESLSSDPGAIALYASRPLSPVATQHSLPSGRCPLLGPVFHRLDRTSLPGALIRSPRRRVRVVGAAVPISGYPLRRTQDVATVPWNLATGMYYKTQPKPPWKLSGIRPGV